MNSCRVCLDRVPGAVEYHPHCLRSLFGTRKVPTIDIEVSKLHTAALAMVGHTSLSGIQRKISLELSADRETLMVAVKGGHFILKPETGALPALPGNEHVTTRLARLVDIEVAPAGLVKLKDGTLAFIIRRFDRLDDGRKLRQEDFCQLAELPPKDKYDGSAERCVKLLRKYATEPVIEILKLYRLLVFAWWSGNGDMHLKNFSLITNTEGITQLTPAYDLVCSELVMPNDEVALPVGGKENNLRRGDWLRLAEYCQLPEKLASEILDKQVVATERSKEFIERSYLPNDQKNVYAKLIEDRSQVLSA